MQLHYIFAHDHNSFVSIFFALMEFYFFALGKFVSMLNNFELEHADR